MTKEDYREKVEEHRQEIELHNESDSKMSRVRRHQKSGTKKQKNPLMTLLVVVFIFIPLSILGYVWFIFEPSTKATDDVLVEEKDQIVEIQTQNPNKPTVVDSDEEEKEENKEKPEDNNASQADSAAKAEKEKLAAEEAKKAEAKKLADTKAAKAAEAKKAEEAQKVAARKAKELEEKKKAKAATSAQQKTHTVQSTDNLYRIALKYYGNGSPANIEKIKAANNLSSDNISTGQVLVIAP